MSEYKNKIGLSYSDSAGDYNGCLGCRMIPTSEQLLRDLQIPENPTALDIGCGTGIFTFKLVERLQGKGEFYGIDISQGMIEKARQKAERLGYDNCIFDQGDAEQLEFPDSTFDLVVSNMVFHYLPDQLRALSETYRVLKSGGQVALVFEGKEYFKEGFALLRDVAYRLEMYETSEIWDWYMSTHRTFEEIHQMFDKVGFRDARISSVRSLFSIDPQVFLKPRDVGWGFWKSGLSAEEVQKYDAEFVKEAKATGFSTVTREFIYAYGKKG